MLEPPAFVDQYAAVPSLHFGWNLLICIAWATPLRPEPVGRWSFVPGSIA